MTKDRKKKLHRIRKGWDCPVCKMHFGWSKQFTKHMEDHISEINKSLARCECGSRAVMKYDPGCTFIHCIAEGVTKAAVAEWNPETLASEWNAKNSQ